MLPCFISYHLFRHINLLTCYSVLKYSLRDFTVIHVRIDLTILDGVYIVVHRVEAEVYKEWLAQVDEACSFNLSQPLIQRNPDNKLISVNFDPQVTFAYSSVVHSIYVDLPE